MPIFSFDSFKYPATDLPPPDSKDVLIILKNDIQAYRNCQAEEQRLIGLGNTDNDEGVVCVRILGWLMLLAADDNGDEKLLRATASAIISCHQTIVEVGKFLIQHWMGIYRKHKNRRTFDHLADDSRSNEGETPDDPLAEKTLNMALHRDGYRCVLTGIFDINTAYDRTVWVILQAFAGQFDIGTTKCALICAAPPTWTTELLSQNRNAEALAAADILSCLFSYLSPGELDGENLYKLSNTVTLEFNFYDDFERLRLWFDPVDVEDTQSYTYNVGLRFPAMYSRRGLPKQVQLKNCSLDDWLQVPSKHYLAAHALCAKVANLSGATLHLESIERLKSEDQDEDEVKVDVEAGAEVDLDDMELEDEDEDESEDEDEDEDEDTMSDWD